MSVTFGIVGDLPPHECFDRMGETWANFHQDGAALVLRAMGMNTAEMVGEFRGCDLAAECLRILTHTQDPELRGRVRQLARVAHHAGDLGRIWYA